MTMPKMPVMPGKGARLYTTIGTAIGGALLSILSLPEAGALAQAAVEQTVSPVYVPAVMALLGALVGAVAGRASKP